MNRPLFLIMLAVFAGACNGSLPGHNSAGGQDTSAWPASFGYGSIADSAAIAALDIDIRPDGKGLPPGSGSVAEGSVIYIAKCTACHGRGNEPLDTKFPGGALVNSEAALMQRSKVKTIGNYWPYATTLYDYIRRAMPFNAPGSLTNDEVYALTAFILQANKVIDSSAVLSAQNLAGIKMPAQPLFIADDRKGGPAVK